MLAALSLCACAARSHIQWSDNARWRAPVAVPVARSNWAVARVGNAVFTFYGLGSGKTSGDIARDVNAYDLHRRAWRKVTDIPVTAGRLASAAVTIAGQVYLLGGYTVSATGDEVSTAEVLRFDPVNARFAVETPMPVPVDDTVALPWRDRWVVLVSGWHATGNVADVQIYDTRTKLWSVGSPWPGQPVFGHAGGLVRDAMVICDGVTSVKGANGKNRFSISDACWRGDLDQGTDGEIRWTALPPHPGRPLYRSGAVGTRSGMGIARVVFAGGSERPYNYNGIGYDGVPAEPSAAVFSFNLTRDIWTQHAPLPVAGMDFRGLIEADDCFHLFGGMRDGQAVSGDVIQFSLQP
jgi:N-acetylneuraminic acid mutarotase